MPKVVKLLVSIFVGADVLVASYLTLAEFRYNLFGQGSIPGAGSALDLALFLIALFIGYVAGDRLYYFLTYKERRARLLEAHTAATKSPTAPQSTPTVAVPTSTSKQPDFWEDSDWNDDTLTLTDTKDNTKDNNAEKSASLFAIDHREHSQRE